MLSYGNMQFSGTCPPETPQPIKKKFCTIDIVGEINRYAKICWNRLAGGVPTDRRHITWKNFSYYIGLYVTLRCLTFSNYCMTLQPKRLNRFARTMAETMQFTVRKCFSGLMHVDMNYISGSKLPRKPKFWIPNAEVPAKSMHSNNVWTVREEAFQRTP
jgi:hypothetical protein